MGASIEENEQPGLGHAFSATAMPRRSTPTRTGDPGLLQDAMDGRAGELDAFPLLEHLRQMLMIEPGVGSLGEGDQAVANALGGPPRGGPSLVAVDESAGAAESVGAPQAPDLSDTPTKELSGLGHQKLAPLQGHHHHCALLHFRGQHNRPLRHAAMVRPRGGRTFSLNSYGGTYSQNIHKGPRSLLTPGEQSAMIHSRLTERSARPGAPLKSVPWAARSKSSHLLTDGKYGGCDSPELEALRFGRQPSCFLHPPDHEISKEIERACSINPRFEHS